MKRTGAVIAAAGLSSRMGAFKPLLPFGGSSASRPFDRDVKEEAWTPSRW